MATNGNSASERQQLEKIAEAANAAGAAALAWAEQPAAAATEDLITRVENVLKYLEAIGRELGSEGGADEREIAAFAAGQRADLHAFVRKVINRYHRRAGELERIMGKTP
jgi:hypothetical protein